MPGAHIFGSWDNSIPIYLCADDNFALMMSLISSKMAPRGSLSKWVEEVSHCPWFWLLVDSPNHLTSNGSSIDQQTGKKLDINWERANEWPWSSRYAFDGEAIWWNAAVYSTNFQETLSNANSTTTLSWKSDRMRSAPKPQMAHPSQSAVHIQLRLSTWKQSSLHESSRGWSKCKWVSVHQSHAQLLKAIDSPIEFSDGEETSNESNDESDDESSRGRSEENDGSDATGKPTSLRLLTWSLTAISRAQICLDTLDCAVERLPRQAAPWSSFQERYCNKYRFAGGPSAYHFFIFALRDKLFVACKYVTFRKFYG